MSWMGNWALPLDLRVAARRREPLAFFCSNCCLHFCTNCCLQLVVDAARSELRARAVEQSMGVSADTWGGGVSLLATSPYPPWGMWFYPQHPQFDLGRGL